MKVREYFEGATGRGVLATAGADGKVDVAVYSRPHFIDEETVAYIMTDRLTHENLKSNPHAAYIFIESGEKYEGRRLYLRKTREETDPDLIERMKWRKSYVIPEEEKGEKRFVVFFRIEKVLNLIGAGS